MPKDSLTFNKVYINLSALEHNFKIIQALTNNSKIMAVVKGDAYGHGLLKTATTLLKAGCTTLAVLDINEALELKKKINTEEICIIAGLETDKQIKIAIKKNFTAFVYSYEQAFKINKNAQKENKRFSIYLKFDTGMGRLGFNFHTEQIEEIEKILLKIKDLKNLNILGIASHLATNGDTGAIKQLKIFKNITQLSNNLNITKGLHSVLSSAGIIKHPKIHNTLLRPGITLYGFNPINNSTIINFNNNSFILKPVMEVKSVILQIKDIKKGQTISYDRTFTAKKDMKIAVVPFGYTHGLSRIRSNLGYCLIANEKANLLGRVCMNLSMYDISHINNVKTNDEVIIMGKQGFKEVSAAEIAVWNQSIPYEVLCLFGKMNKKFYKGF